MIRLLMLVVLGLSACTELQTAVDNTARQGAKGIVTETLATRFPEVPKPLLEAFTDCTVDNASPEELRDFGRSALAGVDEATILTVRNILARPQTQTCLRGRIAA